LGTGVWESTDQLRSSWLLDRVFEPNPAAAEKTAAGYALWCKAVERSKSWA
jgi:glycerol kinase